MSDYYNQSKESFISDNSVAHIEPRTIKLKSGNSGPPKLKNGVVSKMNEDYYGGIDEPKQSIFSSKNEESKMSSKSGSKTPQQSSIQQESIINSSSAK